MIYEECISSSYGRALLGSPPPSARSFNARQRYLNDQPFVLSTTEPSHSSSEYLGKSRYRYRGELLKAKLYVVQPVFKKKSSSAQVWRTIPEKKPFHLSSRFFQRFTPVFSITAQFLQVVEIEGIYIFLLKLVPAYSELQL